MNSEGRRIRLGDEVYEAIGPVDGDGSVFLFNRAGRIRRQIEMLEHQLKAAREELAEAEAADSQAQMETTPTQEAAR